VLKIRGGKDLSIECTSDFSGWRSHIVIVDSNEGIEIYRRITAARPGIHATVQYGGTQCAVVKVGHL
jgi:hypothetical protein